MYKIEKMNYGFKLTFGEFINAEEMKQWVNDSEKELETVSGKFGVFVDMRTLKPLPDEAKTHMESGQKLYKLRGMERSVVILDNAITRMQFKRIGKQTGIYEWERYINAKDDENWEKTGEDWIINKIDPDKD